jgi:hypothetical protein
MASMRVECLDVDDPVAVEVLVDLHAAANAVDQPWHPGYSVPLVRTMATHGWDDQPARFFVGRDTTGAVVAAGSVMMPTRENRNAALVEGRVRPEHRGSASRIGPLRPSGTHRHRGRPNPPLHLESRVSGWPPLRGTAGICVGLGRVHPPSRPR